MKLVLFSDLHAHNHAQFSRPLENGRQSRLQHALDVLQQVSDIAQQQQAQAVLFLGDLFHSRFYLDVDVLSGVAYALGDLSNVCPLYLLRGNHDTFDTLGLVHSLNFGGPNLTVIDKPSRWTIQQMMDEVQVFAIPWLSDANTVRKLLSDCASGDLLLMHAAMREGTVGPSDRKVDAELGLNDIPLDRFKWVFLGDYHNHQELVPNKVMYCGSPLQQNFGERDCEKYILVLDTDTGRIEKIPTKAPKFYQFDSAQSFNDAVNSGVANPNYDFIKVEYTTPETEAIEPLVTEFESVKFERRKESNLTAERCSARVLREDPALVNEYVKNAEGDKELLADYGLSILEHVA
jgi:DNA repair exonuclease SbcCD nuclease subunit